MTVSVLPDDQAVYQHLKIVAASNGISSQRIGQVLDMVDSSHKKKSKIEEIIIRRRTTLGNCNLALLGNPQYLILDEPTNGFGSKRNSVV